MSDTRLWEIYYTDPPGENTPPSGTFHVYRACPALSNARVVSELSETNPLVIWGQDSSLPGYECDDGQRRRRCDRCKRRVMDEYGALGEFSPSVERW